MKRTTHVLMLVITSIAPVVHFSSCKDGAREEVHSQNNHKSERSIPYFDENQAFEFVRQQVNFGPRVPNTEAHIRCRDFIVSQLKPFADTVFEQSFSKTVYGTRWQLSNIVARFQVDNYTRIALSAHWDSRPRSDEDPLPANRTKGVPGANDAASGVALLLEFARCFHRDHPTVGIDLIFFDGEDIGYRTDSDNFCIGSQYFAQNFPLPVRPRYAINFDMVGDRSAIFYKEPGSVQSAAPLVERLWHLGRLYASEYFVDRIGSAVIDDHVQLISIGIPAVDIIDASLIGNADRDPRRRYWHTQLDDLSNLSPATFKALSEVILRLLYNDPLVM